MSPRLGSLKRPPLTKAQNEVRRENLQLLMVGRDEVAVVPAEYKNTVSFMVVGEGPEALVELRAGMNFARLHATPPVKNVWQALASCQLNEDDLEHLADALVQVRDQLRKARVKK
jgi:hypothetical protein